MIGAPCGQAGTFGAQTQAGQSGSFFAPIARLRMFEMSLRSASVVSETWESFSATPAMAVTKAASLASAAVWIRSM